MEKPYIFTLIYKDIKQKFKYFSTNIEETVLRKQYIKGGDVYIDTRYEAKLRLFHYLNRIR